MAIIRTRAPIQECVRQKQTWRWRRRWCGKYSSAAAARKCRVRAAAAHARCVFPAARDAELALDNGRAINGGGRGATRNLRAGRRRCRRRCVAASPRGFRPPVRPSTVPRLFVAGVRSAARNLVLVGGVA